MWVADITCHFDTLDYNCYLDKIYRLLEIEGNKLGGNGFIVRDSDIFSNNKFVSVSIYKIRNFGNWKKKNYFDFPNNKAYMIGDLFYQNPNYALNIRINGSPIKLARFSYIELDIPKGSDLNVKVSFKRKESSFVIDHSSDEVKDKDMILYFEIGPYINKAYRPHYLEMAYGQFLLHILKEETL